MKFMTDAVFVVIFWCGIGEGTLLRQLQCPDTTVVQNFDRKQFLGKWYRAVGPELPLWTVIRPDCARFNFTLNGDGTFGLYIRRATISLFPVNNQDVEECTYFREVDPAKNEGLFVWDREPNANFKGTQLLDTDYTSYAVWYECLQTNTGRDHRGWIHTRSAVPSKQTMERARDAFRRYGLLPSLGLSRSMGLQNCLPTPSKSCSDDPDNLRPETTDQTEIINSASEQSRKKSKHKT